MLPRKVSSLAKTGNGNGKGFPREYRLWLRLGKVLGKGYILVKKPQYEQGAHRCG